MASTGKRVELIRLRRKLSRHQLAERLGITRRQVWRVEVGETQIPADDLPLWAKALGVGAARLVE